MNFLKIPYIKLFIVFIIINSFSCSTLVIRNDDHSGLRLGKIIFRIMLVIPTVFWSEIFILDETNAYQSQLNKDKLDKNLNSLIGIEINKIIEIYGYEYKTINLPNGNTVISYYYSSSSYVAPMTFYRGNVATTMGGYNRYYSCNIYFEIKDTIVVNWRYNGNNCY